jgi:hypothetical protein
MTANKPPFLDKIGQPITKGAIIVYGHALGRCAGLRLGKVLKHPTNPVRDKYGVNSTGDVRITVRGLDDDWTHKGPELLSKNSTLMFCDRVMVIDATKLAPPIARLFDGVSVINEE